MKNQQWGVVLAAIIVCLTLVIGLGKLQQTGITIEDNRKQEPEKKAEVADRMPKSISVNGEGKIVVVPDFVRITAGISELADTTKQAQELAYQKLTKVVEILKKNSISERNYQTSNLTFRAEYDWSDGERRLLGQRVEQILTILIPEIDTQPERVSRIIDGLGAMNKLEIHSVNLDIKDKKELLSRARILAFEEAKAKAESLAGLADLTLDKPLQISETTGGGAPGAYFRTTPQMEMAAGAVPPPLPTGELDVVVTVNVVFGAH